jgi:cephalosporin-C deacetylase-like acetyl esterase
VPDESLRMRFSAILLGLVLLEPNFAQDSYSQAVRHFDYDAHAPLGINEISVQDRPGAKVHDVTYASPKGGVVPAYLVVPSGTGKFAAILWGHWMMPNSSTASRSEFLDEAVALAPAGVVSLLIDDPMVRPGFKQNPDPASSQDSDLIAQEVIDLRRGLDLLSSRSDVDPKRIGYVGHSAGAQCGAILDAIDKRPVAFVFMGDPVSIREMVLVSDLPEAVALRKSVGVEKLKLYRDTYDWADPGSYASHLGPSPALFQYATHDEFIPVLMAHHYFDSSSGPKEVTFYDSTHALNAAAREDRYEFLRKYLALSMLPPETLEKVPATK